MATFIVDCKSKVLNALPRRWKSHLVMPGKVSSCDCHFCFCNTEVLLVVPLIIKLHLTRKANLPSLVNCFHYCTGLGQAVIWEDSGCSKFLLMKFEILFFFPFLELYLCKIYFPYPSFLWVRRRMWIFSLLKALSSLCWWRSFVCNFLFLSGLLFVTFYFSLQIKYSRVLRLVPWHSLERNLRKNKELDFIKAKAMTAFLEGHIDN